MKREIESCFRDRTDSLWDGEEAVGVESIVVWKGGRIGKRKKSISGSKYRISFLAVYSS